MMKVLNTVEFHKMLVDASELEEAIAEVAFVGRSNVGKSSLINAICGRKKLAFTSQKPGKTRTITVYRAAHGKWIVDLPGYGFATGPAAEKAKWERMIEGYLTGRPSLKMVYMIVDAKVGPTLLDKQMMQWLHSYHIPFSILANKCDKVPKPKHDEQRESIARELDISIEYVHMISAAKKLGVDDIIKSVREQIIAK